MTKQSLFVASLFAAAITASGCAQLQGRMNWSSGGGSRTNVPTSASTPSTGSSSYASSQVQEDRPNTDNFTGPVGAANRMGYGLKFLDERGWNASAYERAMALRECLFHGEDAPLSAQVICTQVPYDVDAAIADIGKSGGFGPMYAEELKEGVRDGYARYKAAQASIAKRIAEDPGLAKVAQLVNANWQAWSKPAGERAALQASLVAMMDATKINKRSAFAGCLATTGAAWTKVLTKASLPNIDDRSVPKHVVEASLTSIEASLAFRAYRMCAEGVDGFTTPDFRAPWPLSPEGPFTQTQSMMIAQADKIAFDDRSVKIDAFIANPNYGFSEPEYMSIGRIAALEPKDGKISVVFANTKEKRNLCQEWVATNRIERIVNGRVEYVHTCKRREMKLLDNTPFPTSVSPTFAAGLAVGDYAVVGGGVVWMATRKDKPSMALNGIIK